MDKPTERSVHVSRSDLDQGISGTGASAIPHTTTSSSHSQSLIHALNLALTRWSQRPAIKRIEQPRPSASLTNCRPCQIRLSDAANARRRCRVPMPHGEDRRLYSSGNGSEKVRRVVSACGPESGLCELLENGGAAVEAARHMEKPCR